jgi:hypothetical protein
VGLHGPPGIAPSGLFTAHYKLFMSAPCKMKMQHRPCHPRAQCRTYQRRPAQKARASGPTSPRLSGWLHTRATRQRWPPALPASPPPARNQHPPEPSRTPIQRPRSPAPERSRPATSAIKPSLPSPPSLVSRLRKKKKVSHAKPSLLNQPAALERGLG